MSAATFLASRLQLRKDLLDLLLEWDQDEEDSTTESQAQLRAMRSVDLSDLDEDTCRAHFRFSWPELCALATALHLPDEIVADNRIRADKRTALAMLCRRLAYPARLVDYMIMFGWEKSRLSRISRATASFILDRWWHLLTLDTQRLNPSRLASFAAAIHRKGAPLAFCWGFIDGTLRRVARPVRNQRIIYNGWKRFTCLKYQAVNTPDGIIVHVFGPVEGRLHDSTVLKMSGLERILARHSFATNGQPLAIYGDPAYGLSQHLISPYKGSNITADERRFNSAMSHVRESVEWAFGEIAQQWAFLSFSQNEKVLLQPVGVYYLVATLLTNALNIFRPGKTSRYFDCAPPTLAEYFHGAPEGPMDASFVNMCNAAPYGDVEVQMDDVDWQDYSEVDT